ncbi:glycosyltransferase family 4 protein [Bradyrhizobium sp. U531]|uniref:glycosyltransferase family 4 protein n=1 Tax=Bradyrhizobium sp. U531 TaxID=3053458 RepID=UPI003F420CEE
MRILIHDYSGHPFQAQLSRALAARGHEVLHLYFAGFQTPHGNLTKSSDDPEGFDIRGVSIDEPFLKDSFLKRRSQEIAYGKALCEEVRQFGPHVVVSANTPLDAQKQILRTSKENGAAFVFWVQDLIGEAITRILSKKMPILGQVVGWYYRRMEAGILRRSDAIVSITADFLPFFERLDVPVDRVSVIENWAPLEEMPIFPKENDWAVANDFVGRMNVVYAGTLGFKHNPSVLLDLARQVEATVTVFSEGSVVDALKASAQRAGISNLVVKPWVSFSDLPKMLGAADLVCALMEPDAGVFSVPSKVLSYLAAGKPILAAIPSQNLAARLIGRESAGIVVEPGDDKSFVEAGKQMLTSAEMRVQMSKNGRRFAEGAFNIVTIATRFEAIFQMTQREAIPQREVRPNEIPDAISEQRS